MLVYERIQYVNAITYSSCLRIPVIIVCFVLFKINRENVKRKKKKMDVLNFVTQSNCNL